MEQSHPTACCKVSFRSSQQPWKCHQPSSMQNPQSLASPINAAAIMCTLNRPAAAKDGVFGAVLLKTVSDRTNPGRQRCIPACNQHLSG